jgi:hypothetical protein
LPETWRTADVYVADPAAPLHPGADQVPRGDRKELRRHAPVGQPAPQLDPVAVFGVGEERVEIRAQVVYERQAAETRPGANGKAFASKRSVR